MDFGIVVVVVVVVVAGAGDCDSLVEDEDDASIKRRANSAL